MKNAQPLNKAVWRKRVRNSSNTLCRTVALGSRPSRCNTPRLPRAASISTAIAQAEMRSLWKIRLQKEICTKQSAIYQQKRTLCSAI